VSPTEFPTHEAAIVGGVALMAIALYKCWRCWSAGSWPTVPGEVIHSDTEDQVTENNEGNTTTHYRAWVRYRYEVKGKEYVGHDVSFGFEWHWFEWTAKRVAGRYPEGKRVRVHYRRADPQESTIETGVTFASLAVLSGGIALVVWGVRGPWVLG
jgi:hypothetical protein